MADVIYNSFKKDIMDGTIDLDTDTFKIMLVTSAYTPDQDAHSTRANVSNEVTGTGYTAGGETLTGTTVTQDNTNNRGEWDFDDPSWASSTITARGAVIYQSNGGASSADPLICYLDFGSDQSSSNGSFTINLNAEGLLALT